jgi:hypothetical protein
MDRKSRSDSSYSCFEFGGCGFRRSGVLAKIFIVSHSLWPNAISLLTLFNSLFPNHNTNRRNIVLTVGLVVKYKTNK